MSAEYDDCPIYCGFSKRKYDVGRSEFCKQCPRQKPKAIFERDIRNEWEKVLKRKAKGLKFQNFLQFVYSVEAAKERDADSIDRRMADFISAYRAEKIRFDERERKLA